MKQLDPELLNSEEFPDVYLESPLTGTTTKGLYNPMVFFIRLSGDIRNILNNSTPGVYSPDNLDEKQIQAFSTYLHESYHWWQHVGSNFGFISSLKFPLQAHLAHQDLLKLIEKGYIFKSILKLNKENFKRTNGQDIEEVNRILNNWFDIHFVELITTDPKRNHNKITNNPFFVSIGHSFIILWSSAIEILAISFDTGFSFLPNILKWDSEFKKLENEKVSGFYKGSDIGIPPIGTKAILEGQARFIQMQYLYFASEEKRFFDDFQNAGMLDGVYYEAFSLFLKILKENRPPIIDSPLVALFLLICDIAINPTEGFPSNINNFSKFIINNDPGTRFCMLCVAVRDNLPELKYTIINYSKEEYISISNSLCNVIGYIPLFDGVLQVNEWIKNEASIKDLLDEESILKYQDENFVIRLFFSKYLKFQKDKFIYPQLFCWPGVCFSNQKSTGISLEDAGNLFHRHQALFIDGLDGNLFPVLFDQYSEENIHKTFNQFFAINLTYEMIVSWIKDEGEFSYDYEWLTTKISKEEMKRWVCDIFYNMYKVHPDEITII